MGACVERYREPSSIVWKRSKTAYIILWNLHGSAASNDQIKQDLKVAEDIWEQCGIEFSSGGVDSWDEAETRAFLGRDSRGAEWYPSWPAYDTGTPPEEDLETAGPNSVIEAFYVHSISPRLTASGVAYQGRTFAVISGANRKERTLAHEIGHLLGLDDRNSADLFNLMNPAWTGGTCLAFGQCCNARKSLLLH
jgi:hypothetical protein